MIDIRIKFIMKLYKELKQNQLNNVEDGEIRSFVNDIRKFLKIRKGYMRLIRKQLATKIYLEDL